jgi:hypothetical protein
VASLAPPFNPLRFWASDTEGDILACEDTRLVLFAEGITEAGSMELGFPCAVTTMSEGLGVRRYLWGESLGIAAINTGPELAWSRPMLLVDMWSDTLRDPVVLREQGETSELVVLDRGNGKDLVGPLTLAYEPLGPISRAANDDILVLETELSGDPQTRTYYVERFDDGGTSLNVRSVAHYNWRAPSYIAGFDLAGEHIYIAAAPEREDSFWIEKISLQSDPPTLVWATSPADGWRYPLGESAGRLIVASEEAFVWLDPATGQALSQPFAPDSGNAFLHGVVEQDGSVVMLADATGNAAQGLYIFAPDGTTTLRFRPGAALFRWLAPAWGVGTLVSHYDELHWLHARQDYDALLEP